MPTSDDPPRVPREQIHGLLNQARYLSRTEVAEATKAVDAIIQRSTSLARIAVQFDPHHDGSLASRIHEQTIATRTLVTELLGIHETLRQRDAQIRSVVNRIERICDSMEELNGASVVLALNAWIETARLGTAGQTIGVIATEMKAHSTKTTTATHRILELSEELRSLLAEVSEGSERISHVASGQGERVVTTGAQLEAVFSSIRNDLVASVGSLEDAPSSLRGSSANLLRSLQFQDRMEQILQRAQDLLGLNPPSTRAHNESVGTSLLDIEERGDEAHPDGARPVEYF